MQITLHIFARRACQWSAGCSRSPSGLASWRAWLCLFLSRGDPGPICSTCHLQSDQAPDVGSSPLSPPPNQYTRPRELLAAALCSVLRQVRGWRQAFATEQIGRCIPGFPSGSHLKKKIDDGVMRIASNNSYTPPCDRSAVSLCRAGPCLVQLAIHRFARAGRHVCTIPVSVSNSTMLPPPRSP